MRNTETTFSLGVFVMGSLLLADVGVSVMGLMTGVVALLGGAPVLVLPFAALAAVGIASVLWSHTVEMDALGTSAGPPRASLVVFGGSLLLVWVVLLPLLGMSGTVSWVLCAGLAMPLIVWTRARIAESGSRRIIFSAWFLYAALLGFLLLSYWLLPRLTGSEAGTMIFVDAGLLAGIFGAIPAALSRRIRSGSSGDHTR